MGLLWLTFLNIFVGIFIAFVLLGAAAVAGLLSAGGHTLAMLVVAVSMIATPLLVKAGDRLVGTLDGSVAFHGTHSLKIDLDDEKIESIVQTYTSNGSPSSAVGSIPRGND